MLTIEQAVRKLYGEKAGYSTAEWRDATLAIELLQIEQRLLKEEYARYLKSPKWRAKWQAVMKRDGYKCRFCGKKAVNVHHLTYARIFNEQPYDLVAICKSCHETLHKLDNH